MHYPSLFNIHLLMATSQLTKCDKSKIFVLEKRKLGFAYSFMEALQCNFNNNIDISLQHLNEQKPFSVNYRYWNFLNWTELALHFVKEEIFNFSMNMGHYFLDHLHKTTGWVWNTTQSLLEGFIVQYLYNTLLYIINELITPKQHGDVTIKDDFKITV